MENDDLPNIVDLIENIEANISWKGENRDILFPKPGVMTDYDDI